MKKMLFMLGLLTIVSVTNVSQINDFDENIYRESLDSNEANTPVCAALEQECTIFCWK